MKALGVILVIGLILVGAGVATYNGLVGIDQEVKQSWAQVDNQLQRRYDLIPN